MLLVVTAGASSSFPSVLTFEGRQYWRVSGDKFALEADDLEEIGRADSTSRFQSVVYRIPGVDPFDAIVALFRDGKVVVFLREQVARSGYDTPITELAPGLCRHFKPPAPPECDATVEGS